MRLGVTLPPSREIEVAAAAEDTGIGFVHVAAPAGTESVVAAAVAAATSSARVVVSLHLGDELPVTLAEEIVVLDNLSNGRVAVIAELADLSADAAAEDVALLRASWSGRPIAHRGRRRQVPSGLPGHRAPDAVIVTPAAAQLDIPLWVAGDAAKAVASALGLPAVATAVGDVDASLPVAPGRCILTGELDADRATVVAWSQAGATHLLCAVADAAALAPMGRWLIPEVAMVGFPRVVAESPQPLPWPRQTAAVPDV